MIRMVLALVVVTGVAGCSETGDSIFSSFANDARSAADTSNRDYYPSDSPIVSGKALFREGAYGRAYSQFKRALDSYPEDPAAWLGFAASADMLGRFDQSDFAYRKLQPIIGNRIEFHNNYGYSLLLRGDLIGARRHFLIAYEMDPSNPVAANNLELLRNSVNFPMRAPGDLRGI